MAKTTQPECGLKLKIFLLFPNQMNTGKNWNRFVKITLFESTPIFWIRSKVLTIPLWRQVVPTLEELDDFIQEDLISDPLNEEGDMPVPELVHRYPDRVLLMTQQSVSYSLPILHTQTKNRIPWNSYPGNIKTRDRVYS